jgi:hypothetical protein
MNGASLAEIADILGHKTLQPVPVKKKQGLTASKYSSKKQTPPVETPTPAQDTQDPQAGKLSRQKPRKVVKRLELHA